MEISGLSVSVMPEKVPNSNDLVNKTIVIKLGGSTLDESTCLFPRFSLTPGFAGWRGKMGMSEKEAMGEGYRSRYDTSRNSVLQDIVWLHSLGANLVLVHGGGPAITAWLRRMGKESRFINGLRVTDEETMMVVRMVIVGQINQELVRLITCLGGQAIGLSGLEGALMRADREDEALGLVGRVNGQTLDLSLLKMVLEHGYISVIAPIGLGKYGECLNVNADNAAAAIAQALHAEMLILLTNVAGIYDSSGNLIPKLDVHETLQLIHQGIITGGMIPKAYACIHALETVQRTHIIDGRLPHVLKHELFSQSGSGSMIFSSQR